MSTQGQLKELIDRLSEADALKVLDYIRWITDDVDTEPLTDSERDDLAAAEAERRGKGGKGWAEVKQNLGL